MLLNICFLRRFLHELSSAEITTSPESTYYRTMTPADDGLPRVGRSARMLGVRIPEDIAPDESQFVWPETGGMSVAPGSMWNLPNHRRPRGMEGGSTGPSGDFVYGIEQTPILSEGLTIRPDPAVPQLHAFVEPTTHVMVSEYEAALESTSSSWRKLWP
jgi:hypothetical protein